MRPTLAIAQLGQSLWLDNLSRSLIRDGTLAAHIAERDITGVTSNPAIFQNALATSPYYADELAELRKTEPDAERRFEALAIPDIQAACDLLAPIHAARGGRDGFVSLEVAPKWAHDADQTIAEAQRLSQAVARANLLVKVPGTSAGVVAFEVLTRLGINVNVTLLFSLAQADAIFAAYLRGLAARVADGQPLDKSYAVASVFMSRVDTLVDSQLDTLATPDALALRGRAAVAMAKLVYQRYVEVFHGADFDAFKAAGASPALPLWASTGVKNPAYPDLLYVEPLIGPETVNTLPDKTLLAIVEHGVDHAQAGTKLAGGVADARATFAALAGVGIDMEAVGATLQRDGLALFQTAFDKLLAAT
jgi:transaldolase